MVDPSFPLVHARLRELLDRLSRVIASEGWGADLNPVQRAALAYLARANRFSRAPSHVADYLLATRGTVSQTLKALQRKGFVREQRSETDRRSIAYELTAQGEALVASTGSIEDAIAAISGDRVERLANDVTELLRQALAARGGRSFGVCRSCRHHRTQNDARAVDPKDLRGAWCALLNVDLDPDEVNRICHEHEWSKAA